VFVDPATSTLHVSVHNIGKRTITAYCVHNSLKPQTPIWEDFFASIGLGPESAAPGTQVQLGGLQPGDLGDIAIRQSTTDPPVLEVSAVVFADRTAVGDESEITYLFARRSGEAAELGRWCSALQTSYPEGRSDEELRRDLRSFASAVRRADIPETDPVAAAAAKGERMNLGIAVDSMTASTDVRALMAFLQRRCESAQLDSKRERGETQ